MLPTKVSLTRSILVYRRHWTKGFLSLGTAFFHCNDNLINAVLAVQKGAWPNHGDNQCSSLVRQQQSISRHRNDAITRSYTVQVIVRTAGDPMSQLSQTNHARFFSILLRTVLRSHPPRTNMAGAG